MYTLNQLGITEALTELIKTPKYSGFEVGRISAEHKERYWLVSEKGEFEGEVTGHMQYTAVSRADFPAVGDWVTFLPYESDKVIIHEVLPRTTVISRQTTSKSSDTQIIAANIDTGFIVMAVDRDFSINRVERYITICKAAKVTPVVICNKTDLLTNTQLTELTELLSQRIKSTQIITLSCHEARGIEKITTRIEKSKTYCMLGSSGVGKSTLLNLLLNQNKMATSELSNSTNKGRHTTTHRELVVLPSGGIIIDNPGIREVGIADTTDAIEQTFEAINQLTASCKFKDCTHTSEKGCAIIEAVEHGTISAESYQNFLKLERERDHYQASVVEKRRKDKAFGKMVKSYKNLKKKKRD